MSRCRESWVPLWVFGVKSLSLPLSRDHHTPWLVAPSPSAKSATVLLWASSVVTYPTDHRPESSLLLRARVTQNDLPISRSVTFRTRRPFCHLLQRFEPGHLRGDVLPTTALLQAEYFYDSSALLCVSVVCCSYCRSVSGVWNHHSCMSVLLMGIWVVTSVWLLWIKVRSYTYVFCFFLFPLGKIRRRIARSRGSCMLDFSRGFWSFAFLLFRGVCVSVLRMFCFCEVGRLVSTGL